MHHTAQRSPAKDGSEPAEQPWQVNPESRKQGEEKEQRHHPVQKARVYRMAQQFSGKYFVAAYRIEGSPGIFVESLNRGSHACPPRADPAADVVAPPSRSANQRPAGQTARTCPAPASPAISRSCSSMESAGLSATRRIALDRWRHAARKLHACRQSTVDRTRLPCRSRSSRATASSAPRQ